MIVSRFAPSPTGPLHLGHAFSAVRAHDLARDAGGRFLLRIEDIDPARRRPEHVAGILDDLGWLGLAWDGAPMVQSARMPAYADAIDALSALGVLYPCYCTRAEIAREVAASASAPHGPDGPLYPGTCRHLGAAEQRALGHRIDPVWRLDVARAAAIAGPLSWRDATAGTVTADPLSAGDVVIARRDAGTSYHLAVTVDDAAQGVTDVVRGSDLFAATHVHRLLQALLGLPTPRYHHHELLTDAGGRRLAKRDGAPSLAGLRERGVGGPALADALRRGEWLAFVQETPI